MVEPPKWYFVLSFVDASYFSYLHDVFVASWLEMSWLVTCAKACVMMVQIRGWSLGNRVGG